ncbi:hypothetical protein HRbin40_01596 [bacterium HR40]|nr:hypothetical protein HRbin40_01596 [bacterium HR40]
MAGDVASRASLVARIPQLHAIEARLPLARRLEAGRQLRVLSVDLKPLRHVEPVMSLVAESRAEVAFLVGADLGMARSHNRHVVAELAQRLGWGYAFGVECVELGPADLGPRAREDHPPDLAGLHGHALLSLFVLRRVAMVRLAAPDAGFDGHRGQTRIGSRIALFAQVELLGTPVTLVCTRLGDHDPEARAQRMEVLLDALEGYDRQAAVLMGGDFRGSGSCAAQPREGTAMEEARARDPHRLFELERFESLLAMAGARRFVWQACDPPAGPTEGSRPDGSPRPARRCGGFFARQLSCRDRFALAAVDERGDGLCHSVALGVTIEPAG